MSEKGIIFDFNGTLFWDSQKHYDAWIEMSKRLRGYPFSDYEMLRYMFGRTNAAIIEYAIGRKPSEEEVETISKEKELFYIEMCKKDVENTKLAPGAEEFLNFICEKNIPHTIATMSQKMNVDFFIDVFKLDTWFETDKIVYDDGKINGKPFPDIYLKAAKVLKLKPSDCIVFEDALSGIESAQKAGIGKIIAVASKEPVEFYKNINCIDTVIKDFYNLEIEKLADF